MEQPMSLTTPARRRISTVGKVMVAALVVNACADLLPLYIHLFGEGRLSVPLLVISVLGLLMAGLAATGLRWMPLLGGIVVLVTSSLAVSQPENTFALTHPGADVGHFVNLLVLLVSALVALGAGLLVTIQPQRPVANRPS